MTQRISCISAGCRHTELMARKTRSEEPLLPDPESRALDVFSRDDQDSIINRVPPQLQKAFLEAARARPDLMGKDERWVYRQLSGKGMRPTPTDNRLRIKFWLEYDRALTSQDKFSVPNVVSGVCFSTFFYNRYLLNPDKVAWLLCPPADYVAKLTEILDFGLEQMRDILELPNTDSKGRPQTALMALKAKIVAMAHERIKGAVVQRVEQKQVNLNVETKDTQVANALLHGSMADIDKRLKELESQDRMAAHKASKVTVEIPASWRTTQEEVAIEQVQDAGAEDPSTPA